MKLYKFFLKSLNEELVSLITLMNRFNKNVEKYRNNKVLCNINKFFVFLLHKKIWKKLKMKLS